MNLGEVVKYEGFKFPNGKIRNKLMVIVGNDPAQDKVMVVLTTSEPKQRLFKDGCQASNVETYFVFNANLGGFEKTTWVLLKPLIMTASRLRNRITSGGARTYCTLKQIDFNALKNCFRKSEDVSPYHLGLLK